MVLGLRQKLGISVFVAIAPRVTFCFFFDAHLFVVPSFKNTASIFPEISFIQYFTTF